MSRVILTTVLTIALALWSAPVSAQSAAERFKKADTEAALATLDRNYAKAEKQYRIAIKAADQAGLGGHRLVLTLNNLAEVYYIQRRYAEALPLLKRALALAKKSFGPKNTFTLTLRKKYALFQSKLGQGRPAPKRKTVTRKAAKARTGTAPAAFQEGVAAYERGDYATALRKWRPLAEKGDAAPQFNIGLMYEGGKGVAKDEAQAAVWFRKAAEQGFVVAQNNLGLMYRQGRGVPQDYAEAAKWYRKAAEQGYAPAQYEIGVMYGRGDGVEKDEAQAFAWYRKAAAQGYPKARETLARWAAVVESRLNKAIALNSHAWFLATSDNAGERDGRKAVELAEKAARLQPDEPYINGTLAAAFAETGRFADAVSEQQKAIGMLQTAGRQDEVASFQTRLELYRRNAPYRMPAEEAAEMRSKRAIALNSQAWKLVSALNKNKRDGAKAVRLAEEAARLHPDEPYIHGTLAAAYAETGRFADAVAEQEKAIGILQKARKLDEAADFQTPLGLYRQKQTYVKLIEFKRTPTHKQAEKGDVRAQFTIAQKYQHGNGISRNPAVAARWHQKAASQGHSQAQAFLGLMYMSGNGVKQDTATAKRWFHKAAKQNNQLAMNSLKRMKLASQGPGLPRGTPTSARPYLVAAKKGHVQSQVVLGTMYENGDGVKQDYAEALKWYRKAAGPNDDRVFASMAQAGLGRMYEQGKGVGKDLREAVKWYRKAAEVGHVDGKAGLARIKRDHPEALQ